jgi:hypothetical protein
VDTSTRGTSPFLPMVAGMTTARGTSYGAVIRPLANCRGKVLRAFDKLGLCAARPARNSSKAVLIYCRAGWRAFGCAMRIAAQ